MDAQRAAGLFGNFTIRSEVCKTQFYHHMGPYI